MRDLGQELASGGRPTAEEIGRSAFRYDFQAATSG